MTPADYVSQYVYNVDYMTADQVGMNQIVRQGNDIENLTEIFPNGRFVDFYSNGEEQYAGLGWSSLKIVMEEYEGRLMVVAMIHSE